MIIIYGILIVLVILIGVCLVRALMVKRVPYRPVEFSTEQLQRSTEYAQSLSRLVQVETVSAVGSEDLTKFYHFHKVMEQEFPNIHRVCEKHDFDGSLLFKWKGQDENLEPILLLNHLDVVEAKATDWKTDPFVGEIIDRKIYGRGAMDDKGPLFAMYQGVEELIAAGYVPKCDVYLASSCTEEIIGMGAPKTANWFKEQGIKLRFLLDEGGTIVDESVKGVKGTFALIGVMEKVQGNVKFIAKSIGGHASAPRANTPLVRLGKFMNEIERHYPMRIELTDYFLEMLRRLGSVLPFAARILTANLWLFKPIFKIVVKKIPMLVAMTRTTIAFTTAGGSNGYNVLPQEAYVTANIRYAPHQGVEETHRILEKLAKKYDLEMEVIDAGEPIPVVDYRSEAFALVEKTINEIYPTVQVSPYIMTCGTDAKFYSELTANGLRFAPLLVTSDQLSRVHGTDENLNIDTLAPGVDFYKKLIQGL